MSKFIDLKGRRFGRLLVVERFKKQTDGHALWVCLCDCGNQTIVRGTDLRRETIKSCGCWGNELASKRLTTHGLSKTRLFKVWRGMLTRCYNTNDKSFKRYGGRGILICEEWKNDFKTFYDWAMSHGYTEDLTLDRIDVNGNYEPSNCRWTTIKEQCNNRSTNKLITFDGKTQSVTQWCEELGVSYSTVYHRLKKGLSIEDIFSKGATN